MSGIATVEFWDQRADSEGLVDLTKIGDAVRISYRIRKNGDLDATLSLADFGNLVRLFDQAMNSAERTGTVPATRFRLAAEVENLRSDTDISIEWDGTRFRLAFSVTDTFTSEGIVDRTDLNLLLSQDDFKRMVASMRGWIVLP